MDKIRWDESYSVNNQEIDDQHKEWIVIFNRMHNVLLSSGPEELKTVGGEILKAMNDYAEYHFKFEEEYLRRINYPELFEHRRLHRDFATQIYQFNREVNKGEIILSTDIIKMIRDWLVHHILQEDKKYGLYAEDNK
ncbi:MAG: bacteriohemerythrin [Proteobacteria bacterium]|nr:bacteriohemerythrin [Desulfobulbaceae bacterium]MBU4152809.1 bacteriohemerythrin [Pseudomonadota bacterium]MDP2106970.1 bacteriohemerythrin [Desulfobulbaceae bacterium]